MNSNTYKLPAAEPHRVSAEHAEKVATWLRERGGIAIWDSVDLSDPEWSVTTPLHDPDGRRVTKPHWKSREEPTRIITEPADVVVQVPRVYRRVRVHTRTGSSGLKIKLTDGSTRNVQRLVSAARKRHGDAWFEPDHTEDEINLRTGRGLGCVVIYVPEVTLSLEDYLARRRGGQFATCPTDT